MSERTRHTYKQELIERIESMLKKSNIPPLSDAILMDLSTSSLAEIQNWLRDVVIKPHLVPEARQLPPRRR